MNRKRLMIGTVLLASGLLSPLCMHAQGHDSKQSTIEKPNIIILFTDDQGYGDVGCYGGAISTPNLDRMAQNGMRFTNFYVAAASCTPSRAALLTGCYPQRVGLPAVVDDYSNIGLSSQEFTIADYLKQNGYVTGMFGKWHLGHHPEFMPNRHGFTEFYGIPYSMDMWPFHPKPSHPYPALPVYENEKVVDYNPDVNQMTARFTKRAVDFIERHQDAPFFMYVPYSQPHVPLGASDQFRGKSGQGLYGDAIMELDWSVGEILNTLKRCGIEENTLVCFSSDNGPWLSYGNHSGSAGGLREGKGTTFGGGHKVPFIVSMPGSVPAGKVCDEMVTAMDLLPTVVNRTNSQMPRMNPVDGKDIWPLLTAQKGANTPYDAFFFVNKQEVEAVRAGKWKLHVPHLYRIVNKPGQDGFPGDQDNYGGTIGLALYDVVADPAESTNLAKKHPEVVEKLTRMILDFKYDLKKNSRPVGRVIRK
ncbi:MAG: sulfatase [Marinilabiliaceae bacterium]|nr:sulfatase [Marinilabiliaceae bacterium]